jgi:hypothetical protein
MNTRKKSIMFAGSALAIALTLAGAGIINAQVPATPGTNPMSSLVTAIATKFNLNSADVQAVVGETMKTEHAAREAVMQKAMETRLSEAVTAGKLTQAQADLIKAKMTEMKTQMEADRTANQSLTPEQMKTKMEAQRTALESWATANNIPLEYLKITMKFKGPGGMGVRGMHGDFIKHVAPSSTATQ